MNIEQTSEFVPKECETCDVYFNTGYNTTECKSCIYGHPIFKQIGFDDYKFAGFKYNGRYIPPTANVRHEYNAEFYEAKKYDL